MATITRATAKICPLKLLTTSEYVVQEGWQPNYVKIGKERISRVNIIGIVVQKISGQSFVVDDGTSSIRVVDFSSKTSVTSLEIGDPVLVIGRPRKAEEELFIASEIIRSQQLQTESHWLEERQKFLQDYTVEQSTPEQEDAPSVAVQLTGDDVVDFIRKKDTGTGCETEEVLSYFGKDVQDVIHTLLAMGEVYEIKAGVLKVLE
jgi:hypothetical protein